MKYSARLVENKEHESELGNIRVDENQTIKNLVAVSGACQMMVSSLQNGMVSPVYLCGKKKNEIKPWVSKILKYLNCSFADAFPRYVCDLSRGKLLNSQINDILISQASRNSVEFKYNGSEFLKESLFEDPGGNYGLSQREAHVLKQRYYEDRTLGYIGKRLSLSKERIRQIEGKALRKLRRFIIN